MKTTDRTFKESVRRVCRVNGIQANEIVEGTCLTDAQVASVFNPNNQKGVSLSTAVFVAEYLQKRTGGLVTVDFLIGHQPTLNYLDFCTRTLAHLQERAKALNFMEENVKRLKEEQDDITSYLATMINKLNRNT